MTSRRLIIGVGGRTCAGKDTLVKSLTEHLQSDYAVEQFRFSDALGEILDCVDSERSVEHYASLTVKLKRCAGPDVLGRILHRRTEEADSQIIFWNGVRTACDVEWLRRQGKSLLLYIDVLDRIAFDRFMKRKRWANDQGVTTPEDFVNSLAAVESELPIVRLHADHVIAGDSGGADELVGITMSFIHSQLALTPTQ